MNNCNGLSVNPLILTQDELFIHLYSIWLFSLKYQNIVTVTPKTGRLFVEFKEELYLKRVCNNCYLIITYWNIFSSRFYPGIMVCRRLCFEIWGKPCVICCKAWGWCIIVWVWVTEYVMQCLKFVASFNQICAKTDDILKSLV